MNPTFTALLSAGLIAFLAACSPPAAEAPKTEAAPMADMPMSAMPTVTGPIRSAGVVTAIDGTTVTFQHEPIAAINWGAMRMQFKAENPAILKGIKVGDHVSFELKSAVEPQVVTSIQK